jgi:hypothetical protein
LPFISNRLIHGFLPENVHLPGLYFRFLSSLEEIPKAFQHVKAELPILLETLKQIESAVQSQNLSEDTKQAVLLIISKCHTQITLLDDLVEKELPKENDSWRTIRVS